MVIKTDDTLWSWGWNYNGELGIGNKSGEDPNTIPMKILDNVKSVSATVQHTVAVKKDHTLWIWGVYGSKDGKTVPATSP